MTSTSVSTNASMSTATSTSTSVSTAQGAAPGAPSVHRRALITWLAIYPTVTLVLGLLGPVTAQLPLFVRTLILTAIIVPIAAYGLIPLLMKANAALTRRRR